MSGSRAVGSRATVVVSLALLVAACGGSSTTTSAAGTASSTTSTPSTATPPPTTTQASSLPTFVADKTWTWDGHTSSGYKASFRVQAGKPTTSSDAPLLTGFKSSDDIASACSDFNAQTDAVMPVEVTITNNTPKFNAHVDFQLSVVGSDDTEALPFGLNTIDYVGQQIQCAGTNSSTAFSFTCTLDPGAACNTPAYIVIEGDFSPAQPNGNPHWPSLLELMMQAVDSQGSTYVVTSPTGPGSTVQQFGGQNAEVNIQPL